MKECLNAMPGTQYDHNYLSVAVTMVLFALGVIGFMGRGWFNHVNDNLKRVWQKLDEIQQERVDRWRSLDSKCEERAERISYLEAKVNGKTHEKKI